MAKFLVTSGSKFEPYSYDELVKPLMQATEAHKQTQEVYDELAANAGSIGALIGNGPDTERSRAIYDNYMKSLDSYIDELSNNGYNISAQRGLSQMRKLYGTDVTRIANAITKKDEASKKYEDALLKDPSLLLEYDPRNMGVDKWLDNPEFGRPRSTSGEYLKSLASNAAATMKSMLTSHTMSSIMGGQNMEVEDISGATLEQVDAAKQVFMARLLGNDVSSSDNVVNALVDIMDNVYAGSGLNDWADDNTKLKAIGYIQDGINSAIGDTKYSTITNRAWDYAMKGAGSGRGGNGGADADNSGLYAIWNIGDAEYSDMKKRAAGKLDQDLRYAQAIKQAGGLGADYQFTQDMLDDNQARLSALEAIREYYAPSNFWASNANARKEKGRPINERNQERLAQIEEAYRKAIAEFPEYEGLRPYDSSQSMGDYSENTAEYERIYRELQESPISQINRLRQEYGNGNPNANIDDIIDEIGRQRRERAKVERLSKAYVVDRTDIANAFGDYFAGADGKSKLVTDSKGRNVKVTEDVVKAFNDKSSNWYLDPINARAVIGDEYGNMYYVSPRIFGEAIALTSSQIRALFGIDSGDWNAKQALDFISQNYGHMEDTNTEELVGRAMQAIWANLINFSKFAQAKRSTTKEE